MLICGLAAELRLPGYFYTAVSASQQIKKEEH